METGLRGVILFFVSLLEKKKVHPAESTKRLSKMRHSTFLIKLRFTMSSENVEASVGNKWCISSVWVFVARHDLCVCLLFDMLAAGHRVSHAGAGQDVHIVDDDEWFLLQGDNREVVFVCVFVPVRVVPRPHWEHQRQRPVLPAPHLRVPQTQTKSGTFI